MDLARMNQASDESGLQPLYRAAVYRGPIYRAPYDRGPNPTALSTVYSLKVHVLQRGPVYIELYI